MFFRKKTPVVEDQSNVLVVPDRLPKADLGMTESYLALTEKLGLYSIERFAFNLQSAFDYMGLPRYNNAQVKTLLDKVTAQQKIKCDSDYITWEWVSINSYEYDRVLPEEVLKRISLIVDTLTSEYIHANNLAVYPSKIVECVRVAEFSAPSRYDVGRAPLFVSFCPSFVSHKMDSVVVRKDMIVFATGFELAFENSSKNLITKE